MYSRTPLIRTLVIRIGLALRVNLSRILQKYRALKLSFIVTSTVECYGFYNRKSSVVEGFRRSYTQKTVTAGLQTANVVYFQRKIRLSGLLHIRMTRRPH
jgi:hypothetical protein